MTGQLWEDQPRPEAKRTKRVPAKPPMTERLRAILVAGGYLDDLTGATRKARWTRCPDCRVQVWRGLNADSMAWAVEAEGGPLTAMGEAMARLGGWSTVTLRAAPAWFVLDVRGPFHIRGEPAGSRNNCDVLLVHRCGINSAAIERGPSRIAYQRSAPILPPDAPAPF
jgi:hypothetical protein